MNRTDLIELQKQKSAEWQEEFEKCQQAEREYLKSEQHEREAHEQYEDLWEQKAKREGWKYTRKPFVSAADRQRMAEEAKQQEIAYLKEKLAKLEAQ